MAVAELVAEQPQQEEFKGRGLETYKRWFQTAEGTLGDARRLARRDRDWYDNFDDTHWDEKEKAKLRRRNQPPATSNRIKRKVNFLCGVEQKSRSDPTALARTPNHDEAASVATKVLTYIEDNTRFDKVSSRCFKDLAIEGISIVEIIVEGGEVVANKIDYDKFFYDPRSSEEDFSDARYVGYQDWFDEEDANELFEGREAEIAASMSGESDDEGFGDKPDELAWGDGERNRVRIACMYWKNGKGVWNYVYFTGGGVLEEGVSPYIEDDDTACALIATSAYVTRKNERYGAVRDMISPQRELNYRKSMSVFHLKDNRIWSMPGVFDDSGNTPAEEMGKANGHLIANGEYGKDWGRVDKSEEVSINFNLMQEAKSEIDIQGPNSGLQGRGTEDQSGKAIALQQNAGLAEENTLFDTHNDWKLRVYRAMWWRSKQFWNEERAIRVTDDQNATGFIMVNQQAPVMDEMGQPQVDLQTGQPATQVQNAMADMDVDIILDIGPDMITLQEAEFEQLTKMAQAGIPVPPDVMLEASQLRNKKDLIERIKQEMDAEAKLQQAMKQIEQMGQQIEQLSGQQSQAAPPTPIETAKIQDMSRKADRDDATARADIEHKQAGTAKTVKEIMTPAGV